MFTDWPLVSGASDNSNYGVAINSRSPDVAERGNYYAYFRGYPTDNSQDCLGTYVSLQVGGVYNISYYLGTDGSLTNGAAMWAQIGPSYGLDPNQDVILTAFFQIQQARCRTRSSARIMWLRQRRPFCRFTLLMLRTGLRPPTPSCWTTSQWCRHIRP